MLKFAIILPTLNARNYLQGWFDSFQNQTILPTKVLIIDSSSDDGTVEFAKALGLDTISIPGKDFDHGGTRQKAFEEVLNLDLVIFMTQDVKFFDSLSLKNLLDIFLDDRIGLAYGKQIPHPGEKPFGIHARQFNYGDELEIRSLETVSKYGAKSVFCSDSFACYRVSALIEIGGFPPKTILSEDAYVAGKLLLANWKVAYVPSAKVYHSHTYSIYAEAKRYFDLGVFYSLNSWIAEKFGKNEGNGIRFAISELKFLVSKSPYLLLISPFRNLIKYLFFKLGFLHKFLPKKIILLLTMNKIYFIEDSSRVF
jgi:rhamnosyltransferase